MFVCNALDRLQFYNNQPFNNQIGEIFSKTKSVTVKNPQRFLSLNAETGFPKTVHQTVFINLLQQSGAKIHMQIVSNLPYLRNKIFYVCIFHVSSLSTLPFPYISPPLHFYTTIPLHLSTSTLLHGHSPTPLHLFTSTRPFLQSFHPPEISFFKRDVLRRAAFNVAACVNRRHNTSCKSLLRAIDENRVEDEKRGVC